MRAELVGISLAVTPGEAAYIPLAHRYPGAPDQLNREAVLERLAPWLESAAPKVGHHLKYDAHIFANHGIALRGVEHDTMLESYVLNSTATRHDMDSVAALYLGLGDAEVRGRRRQGREADHVRPGRPRHGDALFGRGRRRRAAAARASVAEARGRAGPRARLHGHRAAARARARANGVHGRHGRRAPPARAEPGARGEDGGDREGRAYAAAGGPFNLGSPKQLQEVLYERLKLPMLGKTPKGQPSTAEDVLEQLAESYELPRLVLEYRALDEAEVDVHRQAADRHRSAHEAHPHVVSPGRRGDGPAVVVGPESSEHPDPHRRRPPHPPGVHRAARIQAAGRRLLADRAADHGAPVRRRRPARGVRRATRTFTARRPPRCSARRSTP